VQISTKPLRRGPDAMQIVSLHVDNFKSLVDFELPLAKLTCLIGLNGAGKSTVIQALDFASRLFPWRHRILAGGTRLASGGP
jgi:ABC-type cobalamin/Fe3+-siderophores transport system ATPase subunit